jgi:glutamyl-tRNA synthetase
VKEIAMSLPVRVRFAPSPTGFMHLGNVRAALLNYLFATHYQGTFILRIEDTDAQRNVASSTDKILEDLQWLNLPFTEGPTIGGDYGPYYQSERAHLYQQHLEILIEKKLVYHCFCTVTELENKRQRQIALKKPPRYDKSCLKLSAEALEQKLQEKIPFIWRFAIDDTKHSVINDLAHGSINFDMKNFSDFALTREDGSFTFLFANFVDDLLMKITHVIRGGDHLSNTANQAALYNAFNAPLPIFWHLPTICSKDGKKLSKRDFGFSLDDLKNAGFLPQTICNYLAIIGQSFDEEVLDLMTLTKVFNFDHVRQAGDICYDLEKITWLNHKWVLKLSPEELLYHTKSFVEKAFPQVAELTDKELMTMLQKVKTSIKVLADAPKALHTYFEKPTPSLSQLKEKLGDKFDTVIAIIKDLMKEQPISFDTAKKLALEHKISIKELFSSIRYLVTEQFEGIGMHELLDLIGEEKFVARIKKVLN